MPTDQQEKRLNTILSKKARVAEIDRALNQPTPPGLRRGDISRSPSPDSPFPPDDPRHQTWLVLRASIQAGEHAAKVGLFDALEKNGVLQLADILTFVGRTFDATAQGIVATVTDGTSAEQRAADLEELSNRALGWFNQNFLVAAGRATGISAGTLEGEIRLRLAARVTNWKAQAFRYAAQREIARATKALVARSASIKPEPKTPLTGRRSRPRRPPDPRKELIARIKANQPGIGARGVCAVIDRSIDREAPALRARIAPLSAWVTKSKGVSTWAGVFDSKQTHHLVRSYVNKVPALQTRTPRSK